MKNGDLIMLCVIFLIIGSGITILAFDFKDKMSIMLKSDLQNQTQTAYLSGFQNGLLYTADYTLKTGNFTYLDNQTIQTMPLMDYCDQLNQGGIK